MDIAALPDDRFREHVRSWIEANYNLERFPRRRLHWHENKPWYLALSRQGWLAPHWPKEWGGLGLGAGQQLIMLEELERHGCAPDQRHGRVHAGAHAAALRQRGRRSAGSCPGS